jgi:plasmid replication initiation protein
MSYKDLIIKNKLLVNISGNATFVQRKLFNTFLHKTYNELADKSKDYFFIDVSEIQKLMGYKSKLNISDFKNDCDALMRTIITWNIIETDKGLEDFESSVLISSIKLSKGQLKIEFPRTLREKIIENKQYIKLSLSLQNKFSSKYSLILYELCKEFYREKDCIGETPWLEVANLKKLFGLGINEYQEFKIFKRAILGKSILEINKLSDVRCEIIYKRESRKITHLKFLISKNNEFKGFFTSPSNQKIETKQETFTTPLHHSLLSQTTTFGISETLCLSWLSSFSPEYIQAKIDLTYSYIKQKKIKTSPSGFLIRAIQEDFGGKITDIDNLLSQEALEARKINPETFSLSPTDYSSQEEFEARIIELESQYYNPRWSEMDMNIAKEIWNLQKVVA